MIDSIDTRPFGPRSSLFPAQTAHLVEEIGGQLRNAGPAGFAVMADGTLRVISRGGPPGHINRARHLEPSRDRNCSAAPNPGILSDSADDKAPLPGWRYGDLGDQFKSGIQVRRSRLLQAADDVLTH